MTLIDKAEALAPCPFCGGEATFSEGKTGDGKPWHYVECTDCEAMGPGVSYADHNIAVKSALADAWNRRAIPARGVGVPEAMRQMIVQAVSFANRAAGEGICIDDLEPETFLFNYSQATGDEDWATLPARILAALSPAPDAREAALAAIKAGFLSAAPGEWRVGDIERVTDAILRAMEGRDV